MAKTKSEEKRRKNKRKLKTPSENNESDSKRTRIIDADNNGKEQQQQSEEDAEIELQTQTTDQNHKPGGVWDNLNLILSLQSKELDLQRKVELAFNFIKSTQLNRERDGKEEKFDQSGQTVSFPRLIAFLIDWIQSKLISSNKNSTTEEVCLDFRCWEVFKFCVDECLSLGIPLSFSQNLLRALSCVTRNATARLKREEMVFTGEDCEGYSLLCDCVVLLFSHRGRLFNANVDLWVSLASDVVDLVRKIREVKVGDNVGGVLLRFTCLVLEPFANYLRVHPSPKNVFPVFVDRLLEPFLSLLEELHSQTDVSSSIWTCDLVKKVEDSLSHGLFHPAHVDGFLATHSMEKHVESNAGKVKNSRAIVKSYHRHFFQKLEKIMSEKASTVGSIGQLFHLFTVTVKKQKGVSVLSDVIEMTGKTGASGLSQKSNGSTMINLSDGHNNVVPENSHSASRLDAATSKSLFGLFVLFVEPLMLNLKNYSETKTEGKQNLLDSLSSLKSINKILASLMQEKIYARTEDDSEGAHLDFLKDIFQTIISFSAKIHSILPVSLWTDHIKLIDLMPLLAKEIIDSLGYFLEIDYEICENDLVSLWLIMFIYSEINLSLNTPDQYLLTSQMLHLGSQLISIYSELRQVHKPIYALCKAIRIFGSCDQRNEMEYSRFISCKASTSFEMRVQSVTVLLFSQDFRLVISNAINSIPQGQVSGCIRELKMDISESLEWVKVNYSIYHVDVGKPCLNSCSMSSLDRQAEFFGRFLSEIYILILDNSAVTTGNCIPVGNSIKDLISIVKPNLSSLVGEQPNSVSEFLVSVIGESKLPECQSNMPTLGSSSIWIFLFFFRLYMSCRSLYRQSISLMPPDLSRKASRAIGDSLTAYCGNDWMDEIDWTGGAYFSWIIEPSHSLLNIIQSVCDTCLGDNIVACGQLIYVLHAMALQRLADLNRQIKAFDFLLEKVMRVAGMKLMNDAGSRPCSKEQKLLEKRIKVLRQEATDTTSFLMRYLSLIKKKVQSIFTENYTKYEEKEALHANDAWDLSVCSLTDKSLPTAIWWILCQNIDIWCIHASKKKLKKFLSCLLQSSSIISSSVEVGNQKMGTLNNLRIVTLRQISLALLSDTIFHEESFICRHLTSRFCHVLEKSVLPLFNDSFIKDAGLNSIPNWPEVLCKLEEIHVIINKGHHDNLGMGPCFSPSKFLMERSKQLVVCQNLVSLLSWMPKGRMDMECFSVYSTYILNLERLVVLSLLHSHGESCMQKQNDLLRLFVYSRRALKCLVMAYYEGKIETGQSLLAPILCENSFSVLWFLKSVSVVVQLRRTCSEEHVCQVEHMIFSLMDHTSYLFLTLAKIQYRVAVCSLLNNEVPQTELPLLSDPNNKVNSTDSDTAVENSETRNVWKLLVLMAETLKEQTQILKSKLPVANKGICFTVVDMNRLSATISCFQGFLWGIASVLNDIDLTCTDERKPSRCKLPHELFLCINEFEDFINFCLHAIVVEEHRQSCSVWRNQDLPLPDCREDSLSSQNHRSGAGLEPSAGQDEDIPRRKYELASDINDECENKGFSETHSDRNSKTRRKMSQLIDADTAINSLNDFESFGRPQLKIPLLQGLLSGSNPELAFLIRELFTASSAILRLKLKTGHRLKTESKVGCCRSSSSSMAIFIWTSQFLLSEIAEMVKDPHLFSFVWLDGVIKYTEVLGNYISLIDTTSSRNAYTGLVNIHLGAIGRCISLQGKGATLASHKTDSCTKSLGAQTGSSKSTLGHGPYCLDEFKARLRMSFMVLIKKPHLLTAMEALERALVGVQEGFGTISGIITGVSDGGKVSLMAAAAVDCFDLVLESVSGRKHFYDVKNYSERLINALFNIILHLHGPRLFYGKLSGGKGDTEPDPGSVTLMCVEVLTKVAGKPSLYKMHSCHVGQSLHVPASLFQDFLVLSSSETPSNLFSDNTDRKPIAGSFSDVVNRQFSIDLFAACCRLLCTVLRHHKSESERCMSVLQSSVCVLLHCLETVDASLIGREGEFSWKLHEGIKCATYLRRIYEEIRQQKEGLGSYCFHFLANCISVYSGNGPRKTGIRREIDEALRPGVYALMEACSPDDLQQLHTSFGEGPCRSTLAALQHDYKQNQYEGKV